MTVVVLVWAKFLNPLELFTNGIYQSISSQSAVSRPSTSRPDLPVAISPFPFMKVTTRLKVTSGSLVITVKFPSNQQRLQRELLYLVQEMHGLNR